MYPSYLVFKLQKRRFDSSGTRQRNAMTEKGCEDAVRLDLPKMLATLLCCLDTTSGRKQRLVTKMKRPTIHQLFITLITVILFHASCAGS